MVWVIVNGALQRATPISSSQQQGVPMSFSNNPYITACPIGCASHLEASNIFLPEGPLMRCPECGQLVSRCSEERYRISMNEFDDPEGTWPSGKAETRLIKKIRRLMSKLQRLSGVSPPDMRLLDVGCSSGAFVFYARQYGVDAAGIEPSSAPAERAKMHDLPVYQGYLRDVSFPPQSFHVITLFEVIEHLSDPVALLKECHRILYPKGLMVIRTGNTDSWTAHALKESWEYFQIEKHGGHISFFNPLSIGKLAKRTGFHIVQLRTHSVCLHQNAGSSFLWYRSMKLISELLNTPSSWVSKGDEIIVYLRKDD
jgi:2-polyprenyl-3-methyl-5-hydroxy-6-metoxy-1,4-benzoquinol methylase